MLTGMAMNTAGITRRIFEFAECLVGRFRGGLAHVCIVASMIFAGMCGAAVAEAARPRDHRDQRDVGAGYPKPFCRLASRRPRRSVPSFRPVCLS